MAGRVPVPTFARSYVSGYFPKGLATPRAIYMKEEEDVELHVLGCRVDILGTNCDQCVSTVQCCFTSTEAIMLIRTGSPGRPPRLSHSS